MIKTKQFNLFLKAARMDPADFAKRTGFNLTRLRALIANDPSAGGISLLTLNNFCNVFHTAGLDIQPGNLLEFVPDPLAKN
jgi:DNA-binding Xre family transcriptional regulator